MSTSLVIAHVTTAHPPDDVRIRHKECAALRDAGHSVHLIARGPLLSGDGVRHELLEFKSTSRMTRMLAGWRQVWRHLRRLRPDVVQVHDPELIPLAIAWRWTHRGSAVVYDAHEFLPRQVLSKPYIPTPLRPAVSAASRLVERFASRALDGVVIAVPAMHREFAGARASCLVQNFPWARDFPRPMSPPASARVGYVGALNSGRGLDVMLKAADRSEGTVLVLAGPLQPPSLATSVGAHDQVEYRGRLEPAAVPALLASIDVGLCVLQPLPNYLEAQSTKLYEYMAAGRPFVYSNFPLWMEQLDGTGGGLAVDPTDTEAVANAISTLVHNKDLAATMGRLARKAFEERFSFEHEARRFVDWIEGL